MSQLAQKEENALLRVKRLEEEVAESTTSLKLRKKELAAIKTQKKVASINEKAEYDRKIKACLLYTSPSPRDQRGSRMPSSA